MDNNIIRGMIGGVVIALAVFYCYLVSRFAVRVARKKSETYGIPEPKIPYVGLILPAPFKMKRPQDVAYRAFYFRELKRLMGQSVVLWALMILLAQI